MSIPRNQVRTIPEAAIVQWASGKTEARPAGQGRFAPFVGFHIEKGKDEHIDAILRELAVPEIEIRHPRQGASPTIARHWSLGETIHFFPVTGGPVAATVTASLSGANAKASVEAGLGIRWGQGEKSRLAVRGYLALVGAEVLVQVSVRSRMTDELLRALVDHVRVCEAADGLIDRQRHPDVVALHEIALPLGPGEETPFGRNDTTTVFPLKSTHPETVDAEYLRTVWRPDAVHAAALRVWGGIQAWARDYAAGSPEAPAQHHDQPEEGPF